LLNLCFLLKTKIKDAEKCHKQREKLSEMPPPTYLVAMNSAERRADRLKAHHPELYEEGYFCFTLDCEKCNDEGLLEGRILCKNCKEKHWKVEWPINKEWRF